MKTATQTTNSYYLDSLELLLVRVGYGQLGRNGELGYENKRVIVQGRAYPHALSTHPPSRLLFHLGGRFADFRCDVALNDDVSPGASHADFRVFADGRQVASAFSVQAGDGTHPLSATVEGAQLLELEAQTSKWEHCHAVWLDPQLKPAAPEAFPRTLSDCLGRTEIILPSFALPRTKHCIATVVTPGFETLLDDMLGSLRANGHCEEALCIVLAVNCTESCRQVAARHHALVIESKQRARLNSTVKAALYTLPLFIPSERFVCLDADMLVLDDLRPLFAAMEVCPGNTVFACREANGRGLRDLQQAIHCVYGGNPGDFARFFAPANGESQYPFVINDGLFCGTRGALAGIDAQIRRWSRASHWVDERADVWWRNQFVFNLAIATQRCGVELDPTYNVQLNSQDVDFFRADGKPQACWRGKPVRIIHFNGGGRNKYPEWRGLFANALGERK
jgi:hypothetical protein